MLARVNAAGDSAFVVGVGPITEGYFALTLLYHRIGDYLASRRRAAWTARRPLTAIYLLV
jgi:hypothetical protein